MLLSFLFCIEYINAFPKGSLVALVSPMTMDGKIDMTSFKKLLDWHVEEGTNGIVLLGTTGESNSLSIKEKSEIIKTVRNHVNLPLIVGTGDISTQKTIENTKHAKDMGADGAMIVTPYYVKPTQSGLYNHFATVADNSDLPIMLYNVPGRTSVDLSVDNTVALSRHHNICGMKDATGDLERHELLRSTCSEDFKLYSGDDLTSCDYVLKGGDGVISVTANVVPRKMKAMVDYALSGNDNEAKKIDEDVRFLHRELFCESNPIPVKWALHAMDKISSPSLRLPLTSLSSNCHARVKNALHKSGCIEDCSTFDLFVSKQIKVKGHLFDKALINQILELIEKRDGQFEIVNFSSQSNDVNMNTKRPSSVVLKINAIDNYVLCEIITRIKQLVALCESAKATVIEYD